MKRLTMLMLLVSLLAALGGVVLLLGADFAWVYPTAGCAVLAAVLLIVGAVTRQVTWKSLRLALILVAVAFASAMVGWRYIKKLNEPVMCYMIYMEGWSRKPVLEEPATSSREELREHLIASGRLPGAIARELARFSKTEETNNA